MAAADPAHLLADQAELIPGPLRSAIAERLRRSRRDDLLQLGDYRVDAAGTRVRSSAPRGTAGEDDRGADLKPLAIK